MSGRLTPPQNMAEAKLFKRDRDLLSIAVCGLQQAKHALEKAHDHDVDLMALDDMMDEAKDAFVAHDRALEEAGL